MKIKVNITVDLSEEQVEILTRLALSGGHGFDETTSRRTLIRRLLESKVVSTIVYCHENIDSEEE